MRAFMKIVVLSATFFVPMAGNTQAFELLKSSPENCLSRHGSVVPPDSIDDVRESCKALLIAPKRGAPAAAHYAFAGSAIHDVALSCKGKYGATVLMANITERECRVFYFPTMSDALVAAFRAPSNNIDQLY